MDRPLQFQLFSPSQIYLVIYRQTRIPYDHSRPEHMGLSHLLLEKSPSFTPLSSRKNVTQNTVNELVRRHCDVCSWFKTTITHTIIMSNLARACICSKQNICTLYLHLEIKLQHHSQKQCSCFFAQCSDRLCCEHTGYTADFAFNITN